MSGKLLLLLAAAGGAAFLLTRKSDEDAGPAPAPAPSPRPSLPPAVFTKVALPPLDTGLTADERTAIQNALSTELKPENLLGFANSFDPLFPLAAATLRGQAAALQAAASQGAITTGGEEPCCDDCASGDKPPCTPHVTGPTVTMGLPTMFGVEIR